MKIAIIFFVTFPLIYGSPNRMTAIKERIVGGTEIPIDLAPYMADLTIPWKKFCVASCGGQVISEKTVLTAAHCLQEPIIPLLNALNCNVIIQTLADLPGLGSIFRTPVSASGITVTVNSATHSTNDGGVTFSGYTLFIHENYDSSTGNHDIAIVKTSESMTSTAPISLPASGTTIPPGTICQIYGWGLTSGNGSPSPKLLQGEVATTPKQNCEAAYSIQVSDAQICAVDTAQQQTVCSGKKKPFAIHTFFFVIFKATQNNCA